jgi:hypothetical protein
VLIILYLLYLSFNQNFTDANSQIDKNNNKSETNFKFLLDDRKDNEKNYITT